MQQHAARQTAGRKETEGSGLPESAAASQPDAEHNLKRPETPQKDPSGNTFLQSLKARYACGYCHDIWKHSAEGMSCWSRSAAVNCPFAAMQGKDLDHALYNIYMACER